MMWTQFGKRSRTLPNGADLFSLNDPSGRTVWVNEGDVAAFHDKVLYIPFHECLEWGGAKSRNGYGAMALPGRLHQVSAHRLSFAIRHNRWPVGFVCHRCDNPGCVRAEHLFEGNHQANVTDKVAKGRCPSRERHPQAVLTIDQVQRIRAVYDPHRKMCDRSIAELLGVSRRAIGRILDGTGWVESHD